MEDKKIDCSITNKLLSLHNVLLKFYGPLHWWPGETELEIIVGAILTQNTNWQNVSKALEKIKAEGLLEVEELFHVDEQYLAKLIKSCGYYNLKARRLKNFINFFYQKYGGSLEKLFNRDWHIIREELLAINGIGPETADSILLYAGGKAVFVVDAYTSRIFKRHGYFSDNEDYERIQQFFMQYLPPEPSLYNEFHAQLVMVGKNYCKRNNPACQACPLFSFFKV
jgi:endonuclease-3 related protein